MRDLLFSSVMAVLLPLCFVHPWMGILVWSWLGYLNPHQHCHSLAKWYIPWAQMVALATLAGLMFTRDRKPFIWCRESFLMILLWIWFTVTTLFAWYPEDAWWQWERVSKVLLMNFLTIPLIRDRNRMRWLLLVIAGSLGFYGFKGGLFVIATGGSYLVNGAPGNTSISANNAIALALNMCLPLFWYLRKDEPRRWLRNALTATFFLSALAVPFTYSRAGLLGLGCVLTLLFVRSRYRYLALPLLGVAAVLLFAFAPKKWVERMETITSYNEDASAVTRLLAWDVGKRIADDSPFVGGGFWVFNQQQTWARYAPGFPSAPDAHSIYYNMLGEHGYVGLGLFLLLMFFTLMRVLSLFLAGRQYKETSWISDYAFMLGVGLVAYLVNGAFLSVPYFDLAWHFLALVVVLNELAAQEFKILAPVRAPRSIAQSRPVSFPKLPVPAGTGYRRILNTAVASSRRDM